MNKELLNKMLVLKEKYKKLSSKHYKTEAAKRKNLDAMFEVRKQFKLLQEEIDWSMIDVSKMNLMVPCGGPICLIDCYDFKLEGSWYFSFSIKGDRDRYVGEFSLLEDKCGIDNLAIIIKQGEEE